MARCSTSTRLGLGRRPHLMGGPGPRWGPCRLLEVASLFEARVSEAALLAVQSLLRTAWAQSGGSQDVREGGWNLTEKLVWLSPNSPLPLSPRD